MCRRNMDIYLVKCLAIFMNIIILIMALFAAYHAYNLLRIYKSFQDIILTDSTAKTLPIVCLTISLIAAAIIVYGFIALCANGFGMLICFSILLALHGLACFLCAFYVLLHAEETARSSYYEHMINLGANREFASNENSLQSLRNMEYEIQCCGLTGGAGWYVIHRLPIPNTCCKDHSSDNCLVEDMWNGNCVDQIQKFCSLNLVWSYIMSFALAGYLASNSGVAYLHGMAVKQFFYY